VIDLNADLQIFYAMRLELQAVYGLKNMTYLKQTEIKCQIDQSNAIFPVSASVGSSNLYEYDTEVMDLRYII